MNDDFNYSNLFKVFFSNIKLIAAVAVVAIVVSSIVSGPYFIKPKYRSESVLYPSNLIPYSSETPTEQLLQLYHSSAVWDSVIKRFNLLNRYRIQQGNPQAKYKLYKELEDNVSISKTSFESVEITILDHDPDTAKLMVEEFTRQVNLVARNLQRQKSKEVLNIQKNQLEQKKAYIQELEDRFHLLSKKYGLLDFETQSEIVTEQYLEAIKKGGAQQVKEIYENFKDKGGEFKALAIQLELGYEELNKLQVAYDNALKDVTKELTYTNEVVSPRSSDKKAYPIRWLIVVLSTISAVLFAFVVLVIVNSINTNLVD